jgi:hypothetical protein
MKMKEAHRRGVLLLKAGGVTLELAEYDGRWYEDLDDHVGVYWNKPPLASGRPQHNPLACHFTTRKMIRWPSYCAKSRLFKADLERLLECIATYGEPAKVSMGQYDYINFATLGRS